MYPGRSAGARAVLFFLSIIILKTAGFFSKFITTNGWFRISGGKAKRLQHGWAKARGSWSSWNMERRVQEAWEGTGPPGGILPSKIMFIGRGSAFSTLSSGYTMIMSPCDVLSQHPPCVCLLMLMGPGNTDITPNFRIHLLLASSSTGFWRAMN